MHSAHLLGPPGPLIYSDGRQDEINPQIQYKTVSHVRRGGGLLILSGSADVKRRSFPSISNPMAAPLLSVPLEFLFMKLTAFHTKYKDS